jgi:2',3'-cyclic-nucleotide 2'-phosphodiesterase (5'-nucleotidase family)
VFPPREVCVTRGEAGCAPGSYEGVAIRPSPAVAASVASWRAAAAKQRAERLGVRVTRAVKPDHKVESPLGNLLSDLLLAATPGADVAILNGGGLRAPLPAGELTYGQLYESQPFDNRVAKLSLTGAELRRVIAAHLERDRHGIISVAGARVSARCRGDRLEVSLKKPSGKPIADGDRVTVVTSDYLATGGDELFTGPGRPAVPTEAQAQTVRDALAGALRKRGGSVDGEDPKLHDARHPRLDLQTTRPIRCTN